MEQTLMANNYRLPVHSSSGKENYTTVKKT